MKTVDSIISARWVIPVEPDGACLDHHSVAVDTGVIVEVLPTADTKKKYLARETIELVDHALIPGLVNAHTHAAMTLFRGLADDLPLMDWLNHHIWPAEAKWVGPEFVRDGSELAAAEMLKGGTTCFNDMYFFPEETAQVARIRLHGLLQQRHAVVCSLARTTHPRFVRQGRKTARIEPVDDLPHAGPTSVEKVGDLPGPLPPGR